MGSKQERRAARALVAGYHEARLAELLDHVADALERYRAGELDAFEVDELIHRYKRAARELWKFCWLGGTGSGAELAARTLEQMTRRASRLGSAAPRASAEAGPRAGGIRLAADDGLRTRCVRSDSCELHK